MTTISMVRIFLAVVRTYTCGTICVDDALWRRVLLSGLSNRVGHCGGRFGKCAIEIWKRRII